MRPLELRLRNFRSYFGEDSVFDLRDRGLVGVVGPIGSGKSSLLDAIAFALFGRTPTVASSTKALIHQRADGATISLRFAVDDEIWEVTRALRRKGQSVHGLHRLAADSPDAAKLDEYVLEGEVNERIVDLLGLEFDGFSRSIMLAQGRFAEFLRSRPAERDKVLKGVFGHDRIDLMRAAAKERAAKEASAVEMYAVRLEAADALAGRIAEGEENLAAHEARLELLRKAEPAFADFAERTGATGRVISHAEAELAALAAMAERIPVADVVADTVEISKSANDTRQRLGSALEEAQASLAAADAALTELDPPSLRATIDEATRLEATMHQMQLQAETARSRIELQKEATEVAVAKLAGARATLESAIPALDAASRALAAAEEGYELASQGLHTAQHSDMAGTLRTTLAAGQPCPVCEQAITAVPPAVDAPATAAAEAALSEATKRRDAAGQARQKAQDEVASGRIALSAAEAESHAAAKDLGAAEAQKAVLDKDLAAGEKQLGSLGAAPADLRKRLAAAETDVADARKRVDLARGEHDESIRSAQAADKELSALRLSLAELATRLTIDLGPTDDVDAVAAAVVTVRTGWADSTETFTTAKVAAERERAEVAAAERALRLEFEIEGEFAAQLAQVVAAADVRRQTVEADQAELAKSEEIRASRDTASLHHKTFDTLASELTDSKFVRYLLDEEKRELADLGSEHFERLSSGRYRFSADGEFHIVDLTSADAVRRADSLSGGETFLASLALALALAEMVARTGGRLDAFFLDEGFGSLDPEHLDLAMEGIEQLASGAANRLVLVVSHVAEMRHRIEDLIELDRDPVTGDTVVIHS